MKINNSQKYLSKEELEKFLNFLEIRKVSKAEVSRILGIKSRSSINNFIKKNQFKREHFRIVRDSLLKKALIGFKEINFD